MLSVLAPWAHGHSAKPFFAKNPGIDQSYSQISVKRWGMGHGFAWHLTSGAS